MSIAKTSRIDRFKSPISKLDKYKSFTFGKSMKSFKNDKLCFTNFVNTNKNENYKRLEDIYIKSLYEDYSFIENDFGYLDEVNYTYKTGDRLLEIVNKGYGHKYKMSDLSKIHKMKNKDNPKFQLYVYESRGNLTVILIDLFHLAIPADIYKNDGSIIKTQLNKIYSKYATNSWNIDKIL